MKITTGTIISAQKVLVYGPEGIGKSTFAACFPDPLFIDTEGSTKHLDVKRLDPPSSWTMLMQEVAYVRSNPNVCRTLIIDTADWAEQLCIAHVCAKAQVTGIEDFGYGKGYTYLAEEFGALLNALTEVINAGIHVVFTAHAQIRKFEQPDETAAYDRWELKLQKKTAPLLREWSDMVLFANYKTFAVKDSKTQKVTAQGGQRVMYTSHRPAWDAKNRHNLPDEMPFSYDEIAPAIVLNATLVSPAGTGAPAAETKAAPTETPQLPLPEGVAVVVMDSPDAVPAVAAAVAEAVGEPQVISTDAVPAHLKPLYDLMTSAGVSVPELQRAVGHKGFFPKHTPIENYPEDFVQGVLIAAWPKVLAVVAELKSIPF